MFALLLAQAAPIEADETQHSIPLGEQLAPHVAAKYSDDVDLCYALQLRDNPELTGRIEIAMTLSQGRVVSAAVESNTTRDEVLGTCVARKAKRWTFSAEHYGEMVQPFVFSPPPRISLPAEEDEVVPSRVEEGDASGD